MFIGLLELVLYDNNISQVWKICNKHASPSEEDCLTTTARTMLQLPDLSAFASLEKLDLSINHLRSMAPLSTLQVPQLQELYLTSNKLSIIEVLTYPLELDTALQTSQGSMLISTGSACSVFLCQSHDKTQTFWTIKMLAA